MNAAHARTPFKGAEPRKLERPQYRTAAQTQRRRDVVQAFLEEHGFPLTDGTIGARCPDCGRVRTRFVADHVVPIAHGGSEDGELRVHCRVCSSAQGAKLANEQMRRGTQGIG